MLYKMKEEIINGFLYLGKRPYYFNQEGRMDSLLHGDMFEIDDATKVYPMVHIGHTAYMVSRSDIVEVDKEFKIVRIKHSVITRYEQTGKKPSGFPEGANAMDAMLVRGAAFIVRPSRNNDNSVIVFDNRKFETPTGMRVSIRGFIISKNDVELATDDIDNRRIEYV